MACIQERQLKKDRHRPTLKSLPDLFDQFGGDVSKVAKFTGYSRDQVYTWINEAPDEIREWLLQRLAKARAARDRAKLLRPELPAFIIPVEIRPLIRLYYRTPWPELQLLEVSEVLAHMDEDPDAPKALRRKLTWQDLRDILAGKPADLDADLNPIPGTAKSGISELTVQAEGMHLTGWHEHVLLSWIGLGDESPLWEHHEHLPKVVEPDRDGQLWPVGDHLENTLRLLIQRLEPYL